MTQYQSPACEMLTVATEGILCSSGTAGTGGVLEKPREENFGW